MRLLLIVGTANDVFIYNMAKWLKASMDITIDVIEMHSSLESNQNYPLDLFNKVYTLNKKTFLASIPGIRLITKEISYNKQIKDILKDNFYDIIHIHYFLKFLVFSNFLTNKCNRLFVTFWGGEIDNHRIFASNSLFKRLLYRFLKQTNGVVNSLAFRNVLNKHFPSLSIEHYPASLGSVPIEYIYTLAQTTPKEISKRKLGIPEEYLTVLIGYSGKKIHNHIPIIKEFMNNTHYNKKIHLLAPMTRGADANYISEVESLLKGSGYSYTLIKDCFLSDSEIAELRNATDVVLQLSSFDAFSRSIIECLCAKSIVLYGKWLAYEEQLKINNFHAFPVADVSDAIKEIGCIINNYDDYVLKIQNNTSGAEKHLWANCIKNWVNLYKSEPNA